jgi:hypothetical protein
MTITEQLEGLLPADGPMTKTDRIIAEAVGELRTKALLLDLLRHSSALVKPCGRLRRKS